MITAKLETITPKKAAKWLETNQHNRPVSRQHVSFLAEEIRSGRWKVNGQPISFNCDGLIDGQHRLWAIIEANQSAQSMVVRGVDQDAFDTVDTGKKRTLGNVLKVRGETNPTLLASAVSLLTRYQEGMLHSWRRTHAISIGKNEETLKAHPDLRRSVEACKKTPRFITPTQAIVAHYLCWRVEADEADRFYTQLLDGVDIAKDSPVGQLRAKLIDDSLAEKRWRVGQQLALCLKAWNLHRLGERRERLFFSVSEKFPLPV